MSDEVIDDPFTPLPATGGHLRDAAPPPPQMPRKNHGKEVVFRDLLLELML